MTPKKGRKKPKIPGNDSTPGQSHISFLPAEPGSAPSSQPWSNGDRKPESHEHIPGFSPKPHLAPCPFGIPAALLGSCSGMGVVLPLGTHTHGSLTEINWLPAIKQPRLQRGAGDGWDRKSRNSFGCSEPLEWQRDRGSHFPAGLTLVLPC